MKGMEVSEGRVVEDLDGTIAGGEKEGAWVVGVSEGCLVGLERLWVRCERGRGGVNRDGD